MKRSPCRTCSATAVNNRNDVWCHILQFWNLNLVVNKNNSVFRPCSEHTNFQVSVKSSSALLKFILFIKFITDVCVVFSKDVWHHSSSCRNFIICVQFFIRSLRWRTVTLPTNSMQQNSEKVLTQLVKNFPVFMESHSLLPSLEDPTTRTDWFGP
jgi:hypothetical protein